MSVAESIFDIDETQWDTCAGESPVVRHGFFRAMELSGSIGPGCVVVPRYVVLKDAAGQVIACTPTMLKWGNLREFGPEIGWLNAGLETDCFSWPKFQACSPYFPRMAPKLLTHPSWPAPELRAVLLEALSQLGEQLLPVPRSAFNLMHIPADLAQECAAQGAVISREARSVWRNPGAATFEEYLGRLPSRKRRAVRRERAEVAALGLTFETLEGAEISDGLIEEFHSGFAEVCARHGIQPWLQAEAFRQLCRQMPESVLLSAAFQSNRYVAGIFTLRGGAVLYLDTWSARNPSPGLSFELACYRPIEYAIANGLHTIDAGLVSGYKGTRGYTADPVFNAHWFYNERLAALATAIIAAEG